MRLVVIGSNSKGNGYLLQGKDSTLLIECGVHINKIKQALNYNLRNVHCIISHCHGDHAKSIKEVLHAGITVRASRHTLEAKGVLEHHRSYTMAESLTYTLGGFKVKGFSLNHDVPCFGFLIQHEECGLTLFLTDTYYCDYTFPGLNNIIVECNHDTEIIESNGTSRFLHDRIVQSHMNLDTCRELLLANDLSAVNNIVLMHLSDKNSDAGKIKREIETHTGKSVFIAEAGLTIENFNKSPI